MIFWLRLTAYEGGGKQAKAHIFTQATEKESDSESEVSSGKSELCDGDEFVTPDTECKYTGFANDGTRATWIFVPWRLYSKMIYEGEIYVSFFWNSG